MTIDPDKTRPLTHEPAALWKECITFWRDLVAGFGRSVDLMRWGRMRALYHRVLGHELRELEALVRRVITSEAITRVVPPPKMHRRPKQPRRDRASPESSPHFSATNPSTWTVTFRMSKREYDRARQREPRPRSPRNTDPEALRSCRGYAFRIEALRRAITDSEPFIMRFARRLARLDEADRIDDPILLPLPDDPPDHRPILVTRRTDPQDEPVPAREIPPENAKHIEPG